MVRLSLIAFEKMAKMSMSWPNLLQSSIPKASAGSFNREHIIELVRLCLFRVLPDGT